MKFSTSTRIRIYSSTQDSSGNIVNRACVAKRAKFASYFALREPGNEDAFLNSAFTVKNWARSGFCIRLLHPHDFGVWWGGGGGGLVAYSKISTQGSEFSKLRLRMLVLLVTREGKPYPKRNCADSKTSG